MAAVVAAVWFAGCSGNRAPRTAPKRPGPVEKQAGEEKGLKATFEAAQIIWDDEEGRHVFKAQFKEAIASQSGNNATVELRGVSATLYRKGEPASTLVAPRVVADSKKREVRASGGIKITAKESSARAERIVWKSREDKLLGAGMVRMTKGNISITAHRFEADTGLERARFVDGRLSIE